MSPLTSLAPSAPWAARSGRDAYGAFADLEIRGQVQRFRWCPPGSFMRKGFQVTLTRGFWMGETPVTQGLWSAVMGVNPSRFRSALSGAMPVERVSWGDSVWFVNELSRMKGWRLAYAGWDDEVRWDQAAPGFRLSTEAEWEYAARAGQDFEFAGSDGAGHVAWTGGNSGGRPHPVGRKAPNAWGLRDMSGNVWEWCWNRFERYPGLNLVDPVGPSHGSRRVVRGGSWYDVPSDSWVTLRGQEEPDICDTAIGLRLVRTGP